MYTKGASFSQALLLPSQASISMCVYNHIEVHKLQLLNLLSVFLY